VKCHCLLQNEMKSIARREGSEAVVCQVRTELTDATRFFMKERMTIKCFAFSTRGDLQARCAPISSPVASPASPTSPASSPSSEPAAAVVESPRSPSTFDVRSITDDFGKLTPQGAALLAAGELVHRQLCPRLVVGTEAYITRMQAIFASGGRMIVAVEKSASANDSPIVLGVCVYRYYTDFVTGTYRNWVDDLVTDSARRSTGVGHGLIDAVRAETRSRGVETVQLDTGVQRKDAQRFYFREGFIIDAYTFTVPLNIP
jgi:GNAT superfamily N-acetyltransferase